MAGLLEDIKDDTNINLVTQIKNKIRSMHVTNAPLLICLNGANNQMITSNFWFESAWLLEESYGSMLNGSWGNSLNILNTLDNVKETLPHKTPIITVGKWIQSHDGSTVVR